eukprot:GCRY01001374.1.p1 GENE.GCRY01001374.1~~GCRY01001374.1.p1  ORF type:complete len:619 (+),score=134.06 GCRY01001374.1:157-2013(+)
MEEEFEVLASIFDNLKELEHTSSGITAQLQINLDIPEGLHIFSELSQRQLHFLPPLTFFFSIPHDFPDSSPHCIISSNFFSALNLCVLVERVNLEWDSELPSLFTLITWLKENTVLFLLKLHLQQQWDLGELAMLRPDDDLDVNTIVSSTATGLEMKLEEVNLNRIASTALQNDGAKSSSNSIGSNVSHATPKIVQAGSSGPAQMMLVQTLTELYSDEEWKNNFSEGVHKCCVCLESFPGEKFHVSSLCDHCVCLNCFEQIVLVNMDATNFSQIACPLCHRPYDLAEIRASAGPTTAERLNDALLTRFLGTQQDIDYCPRCGGRAYLGAKKDAIGKCGVCHFIFCVQCRQPYHPAVPCSHSRDLAPPREMTVDEEQQYRQAAENALQDINMLQSKQNDVFLSLFTKPCPRCSARIFKTGGCRHMHCSVCNMHFCWRCLKDISEERYAHFRAGACTVFGGGNGNVILGDEGYDPMAVGEAQQRMKVLDKMERKVNEMQNKFKDILDTKNIGHAVGVDFNCPKCGADVTKKTESNSLRCFKCNIFFCAVCGEEIFGRYHFSPYACFDSTPLFTASERKAALALDEPPPPVEPLAPEEIDDELLAILGFNNREELMRNQFL